MFELVVAVLFEASQAVLMLARPEGLCIVLATIVTMSRALRV